MSRILSRKHTLNFTNKDKREAIKLSVWAVITLPMIFFVLCLYATLIYLSRNQLVDVIFTLIGTILSAIILVILLLPSNERTRKEKKKT